jgi:hypothetical protein
MRDVANCWTLFCNELEHAMVCNPDEPRNAGRSNHAVRGLQTERSEDSQGSLVERVCVFLERYANTHHGDVKILRAAGPISGGNPQNG